MAKYVCKLASLQFAEFFTLALGVIVAAALPLFG